jgi:hypothetical protein
LGGDDFLTRKPSGAAQAANSLANTIAACKEENRSGLRLMPAKYPPA